MVVRAELSTKDVEDSGVLEAHRTDKGLVRHGDAHIFVGQLARLLHFDNVHGGQFQFRVARVAQNALDKFSRELTFVGVRLSPVFPHEAAPVMREHARKESQAIGA